VAIGLSISNGFSLLAPRAARRLVLTGELVDAAEARRLTEPLVTDWEDRVAVALEREFGERFVRIHRNCIVARDAVRGFERATATEDDEAHWLVVLEGIPERLPVSRRQWAMVRALVAQS